MTQVRNILALAALCTAPAIAGAQVTTFMPPPAPTADSVAVATATADSIARRDSVAAAQVANMKAWVDSAAGDVVAMRPDSAGMTAGGVAQSFEDGSRAPETATPLPLLAVLGAGAMGAGFLIRRARA